MATYSKDFKEGFANRDAASAAGVFADYSIHSRRRFIPAAHFTPNESPSMETPETTPYFLCDKLSSHSFWSTVFCFPSSVSKGSHARSVSACANMTV